MKRPTRSQLVEACALYLLGRPTKAIKARTNVSLVTVIRRLSRTGHFKLRLRAQSCENYVLKHYWRKTS